MSSTARTRRPGRPANHVNARLAVLNRLVTQLRKDVDRISRELELLESRLTHLEPVPRLRKGTH